MAVRRITMQDIADSCGLSRNTVSKIFNGRGAVPDATRRMVLERAQELGYRQLPEDDPGWGDPSRQNIALFTSHMPSDYHFGTFFMPAFAAQLSRAGYTLMMYELTEDEFRHCRLPARMSLEQTAGILGIELFSREYVDMICSSGLPAIFVDAYAGANTSVTKYDLISMENVASTMALTRGMILSGAGHLGFVGDTAHCNSFHERWIGFTLALREAGLNLNRDLSILDRDGQEYSDPEWFRQKFLKMPALPDGFMCANDYIALRVMTALKQMGVAIPGRVMVAGFDGTPQAAVVEPALSTAQIPGADIGRMAAEMLLDRIENPDRPYRTTYVGTTPVLRASTVR